MAIADNKVVTFKDLYGANSMASFSDVTAIRIELPFFRGRVTPSTQIYQDPTLEKYYSQDQYNKRLKYLYYGYAFYGNSTSPANIFDVVNTNIPNPMYVNGMAVTNFYIMVPTYHTGNCTCYTISEDHIGSERLRQLVLYGTSVENLIMYSSISSLADEDIVNDIWMEYKPILKTDPSTGEPMKDGNGNPLYETDEEGNVLYEEGDYYAETRRADEDILPI